MARYSPALGRWVTYSGEDSGPVICERQMGLWDEEGFRGSLAKCYPMSASFAVSHTAHGALILSRMDLMMPPFDIVPKSGCGVLQPRLPETGLLVSGERLQSRASLLFAPRTCLFLGCP